MPGAVGSGSRSGGLIGAIDSNRVATVLGQFRHFSVAVGVGGGIGVGCRFGLWFGPQRVIEASEKGVPRTLLAEFAELFHGGVVAACELRLATAVAAESVVVSEGLAEQLIGSLSWFCGCAATVS